MSLLILFSFGLFFSFIGSIPPGTINISVMQYGLQNRKTAALSFALAAALAEYLYAALAVRFQIFLTTNDVISDYFQMISGIVLILLGLINLLKKPKEIQKLDIGEKRKAFKKGVMISLANPLAIPFWLMVTTYLQSMHWITLTNQNFWIYVAGISSGTFFLLLGITYLSAKFSSLQNNHLVIYKVPGLIFIGMGVWSFA